MIRLTLKPEPVRPDGTQTPVGTLFADLSVGKDGALGGDARDWILAVLSSKPDSSVVIKRTVETVIGVARLEDGAVKVEWA